MCYWLRVQLFVVVKKKVNKFSNLTTPFKGINEHVHDATYNYPGSCFLAVKMTSVATVTQVETKPKGLPCL